MRCLDLETEVASLAASDNAPLPLVAVGAARRSRGGTGGAVRGGSFAEGLGNNARGAVLLKDTTVDYSLIDA